MGISLNLTNFQDHNIHDIPTFYWNDATVYEVRSRLMDVFDFYFTSHGLESSSSDDFLWHFFMATNDTIFSPQECRHLTNVLENLHISHYDDYLQELKDSFYFATQWKCSLSFRIVKD